MHVHCGSLALEGDAGVDNGFLFTFTFCFPEVELSSFNEYDEEAFLENLNGGLCNTQHTFMKMTAPNMDASKIHDQHTRKKSPYIPENKN